MLKAAEARNDIDLTVYVGDLQEGAEIAKRSFHDQLRYYHFPAAVLRS